MKNQDFRKVILMVVIFTFFFSLFRILQHYTFTNNAFDDGFNDNLIWNTLHGNFMYSDIKGYCTLGDHLELLTLAFLPFYLIGLGPWILYIGQTLLIALGAIPVYWLAKEKLADSPLLLFFPLAYLLYLPTVNITFQGYYPIALTITPLLFATYYLLKDNYRPFGIWLLVAALCQENMYLVAACFGLYILLFKDRKWLGALLFALGTAAFVLAVSCIIPHFNSSGEYAYYGRYAYLGNSVSQILLTLIRRPFYVLAHVLTAEKIYYLVGLFWPVAFLSFYNPSILIPALPIFSQNLLSVYHDSYQLGSRYPSAIVPFIFISAVIGLSNILKKQSDPSRVAKINRRVRRTMIFFMVISMLYFLLGFSVRYIAITPSVKEGHAILKLIPAEASVSALGNLYPHLCHRKAIWLFPKNWEKADYIILCRLDPTWPIEGDYGPAMQKLLAERNYPKILEYIFIGETPLPGPLSKSEYPPVFSKMITDPRFAIEKDGQYYLLLKRKTIT
jgi:uncharacterized membrane protein